MTSYFYTRALKLLHTFFGAVLAQGGLFNK
jgi:hypothetical protein